MGVIVGHTICTSLLKSQEARCRRRRWWSQRFTRLLPRSQRGTSGQSQPSCDARSALTCSPILGSRRRDASAAAHHRRPPERRHQLLGLWVGSRWPVPVPRDARLRTGRLPVSCVGAFRREAGRVSTALRCDRRTIAQRVKARSVPCPRCGVEAGEPCYDGFQKRTLAWEHADRAVALWHAEREAGP